MAVLQMAQVAIDVNIANAWIFQKAFPRYGTDGYNVLNDRDTVLTTI